MISKENAYRSVVAFIGSDAGEGFDLDDEQVEKLAKHLRGAVKVDVVMVPEAVLPHATELFPHMGRQSEEEIKEVANRYAASGHWQQVSAGYAPPWGVGASKANFLLLANAIKDFRATGKRLRVDHIAEIVFALANRGVLERVPQTVVVETAAPPPPPTPAELAREKAKKIAAKERSLQNRDVSPIRGAKSQPAVLADHKDVLTEAQKEEINAKNNADNEIIQTALWRLNTFTGRTHGHTASGRAVLKATFEESMDAGLAAQAVLDAVVAKIDQLTDSGSIR